LGEIENAHDPSKELDAGATDYRQDLAAAVASFLRQSRQLLDPFVFRPEVVWWMMEKNPRKHLEQASTPQGVAFMLDMLPVIGKLMGKFPRDHTVEIVDVGGGASAGANLVSMRFRGKAVVTVVDSYAPAGPYVQAEFPKLEFILSDLIKFPEENDRQWDIVICSHVIEHFADPMSVIRSLQKMAKYFIVLYAPFEERQRIEGHEFTFTGQFIEQLHPLYFDLVHSEGWSDGYCFLAVLPGQQLARP
jgi:SAM-dependent methyltransferase